MNRTRSTRRSYAVDLTVKQFIKIENRDDSGLLKGHTLLAILSKTPIHSIEYNGHFGASIFYSVDTEDDTEELRKLVEKIIVDYANGKSAREFINA